MRARLTSSFFLALVFAVTVCLASANPFEPEKEEIKPNSPCTVCVWVRAEDLSPNHVSRGELRIKVLEQECANQVASVVLRLQLDEFGESKHLKEGAVWPKVPSSDESAFESTKHSDSMGSAVPTHDYNDGLNDPKLWTIKAEERRAWTTEAILLQHPDLSEPIIAPFTVAVPAVNYPAVVQTYRGLLGADGHTENIQAGYTAFIPWPEKDASYQPPSAPFTWNVTFEKTCTGSQCDNPVQDDRGQRIERCLPKDQRSVFAAEVTVESGKIVAPGQSLKGRVTIHTLRDGATTLSDIEVRVKTVARAHGDSACSSVGSAACKTSSVQVVDYQLRSESDRYSPIFSENDSHQSIASFPHIGAQGALRSSHPQFSFEFKIPRLTPIDFVSYYSSIESLLQLRLTVLHSVDTARCMYPNEVTSWLEKEEEDAATTNEGLWDMWTPAREPPVRESTLSSFPKFWRSLTLEATLPITVPITFASSEPSEQAIAHYLSPNGAVAPVLRSGLQMDMPASFPSAEPFFVVEDIVNTSARLLPAEVTDRRQWEGKFWGRPDYSDPTSNYRKGKYAGALWKKKVVAEEMGIWPPREGKVLGED
ncbi:hypothetical protein R3P38DRAFT_3269860 [Favolaschia claudopus]|uniref:Arrestin-like N-terminal domain-containing protein n=1 Tax=Favolaschia claudopus TaxID=2862362 RepID=A0AAW0BG52_9AGAR